jgi:hypothetical protein
MALDRRVLLVEGRGVAGSVPVLSTGGVDGPPSSSGLGHHPFKVAARVRIPLGVHITTTGPVVKSGVHAGLSSRRSRVQVPSGPQRHRCARARRQRADGRVAQSAERPPEKRKVPGSTPGSTTTVCPMDDPRTRRHAAMMVTRFSRPRKSSGLRVHNGTRSNRRWRQSASRRHELLAPYDDHRPRQPHRSVPMCAPRQRRTASPRTSPRRAAADPGDAPARRGRSTPPDAATPIWVRRVTNS